ncbi:hypothetical protein N7510_010661 [Penicillium lagena]|uniref:uncharacterized protein n=1 Tax=Penicillium lagena TaxID=94218 RepID=UPI002540A37E|nr:uncharacterized protein N7510_010661 [Penicillium lagena]KAJ5601127.1 hypothetical protein N7510_010661 [Penicillium lagena]
MLYTEEDKLVSRQPGSTIEIPAGKELSITNGIMKATVSRHGMTIEFKSQEKKPLEEYAHHRRAPKNPKCSAQEIEARELRPILRGDCLRTIGFVVSSHADGALRNNPVIGQVMPATKVMSFDAYSRKVFGLLVVGGDTPARYRKHICSSGMTAACEFICSATATSRTLTQLIPRHASLCACKAKKNYYEKGIQVFWLDEVEPDYSIYYFNIYRYHAGSNFQVGNILPKKYARGSHEFMQAQCQPNIVKLLWCTWAGSQKYGALFGAVASRLLGFISEPLRCRFNYGTL